MLSGGSVPINSADYHLLIVSDLHLSEGRDERTHRLSRNEDFFFDEEFARFLNFHVHLDASRKWHLIINGDFLDFLQVISTDFEPEFLQYLGVANEAEARDLLKIGRQDTRFGFDAGPGESVFKLWKILDGHWLFTLALVRFLESGNLVSIGRGNHDPEFAYDIIREHFRRMLVWFYSRKRDDVPDAVNVRNFERICAQQVQFLDWFYYEPGVIWAEHGGQYDSLNCFPHWLAPYLPHSDHIEVPWGSFFVRYLFDSIETEEPFADNIKPQSRFVLWFVTHRPALAIRFIFGNGKYMLKKMARAWRGMPKSNPRQREHEKLRAALEQQWNLPGGTLADLDAQQADSVLRKPHGIWKLWKWLTREWKLSLILLAYILVTIVIGAILIIAQIVAPIVPEIIRHPFLSLMHTHGWLRPVLDVLLVSRAFTFVYLLLALGYLIWQMFPHPLSQCYLVPKAEYVRNKLNVDYVTMGHTHDTDLSSVGPAGEYYNTGTWTKVFSQDERLIREESELVFLQGMREPSGLKCKLMRWNDGANEPRLVKLFTDVAPANVKRKRRARAARA